MLIPGWVAPAGAEPLTLALTPVIWESIPAEGAAVGPGCQGKVERQLISQRLGTRASPAKGQLPLVPELGSLWEGQGMPLLLFNQLCVSVLAGKY